MTSHKSRAWSFGLIVLVIALIIIPAYSQTPTRGKAINVGSCWSLNAGVCRDALGGMQLYIDEVNAQGGIKGRPINLIVYNDEQDSTKTTSISERLLTTDKCNVLAGYMYSFQGLAVRPLLEKYRVAALTPAGATEALSDCQWIFRQCGFTPNLVSPGLIYAKSKGLKNIGIMWLNTAYGTSMRDAMLKLVEKYEAKVTASEGVEVNATDVTIQIGKMRKANVQLIVMYLYEKELVACLQGVAATGGNLLCFDGGDVLMSILPALDKRVAEGHLFYSNANFKDPTVIKILDAWKKRSGNEGGGYIIMGYDNARVLVEALKSATNMDDGTAIRDAIRKVSIPYIHGLPGAKVDFATKNWGIPPELLPIYRIENGQAILVK